LSKLWPGVLIVADQHSTTNRYLESLGFQVEEIRESMEALSRGPAEVIPLHRKEKAL
jgi:hypothetical protein